jgi:hypothetical protein
VSLKGCGLAVVGLEGSQRARREWQSEWRKWLGVVA